MIGLIVLAVAGAWLLLSAKLARYGASKVRQPALSFAVGVAIFTVAVLLPFADEIVGRWQFQRLCASEAIVYVSPTANKVVAAKEASGFVERQGFIFPIREQSVKYADSATGEIFYSVKAFHTPGGLLMRGGLGLGNSTACWPKKWSSRDVGLNIDELLKRGRE